MARQVPFGLKRSVAQPEADGTGRTGGGKKETAGEMMEPFQQESEQGDGRQEASQEEDQLEKARRAASMRRSRGPGGSWSIRSP
jgi:hypothetical protein